MNPAIGQWLVEALGLLLYVGLALVLVYGLLLLIFPGTGLRLQQRLNHRVSGRH